LFQTEQNDKRPGDGPLTEPTAAARPWQREPVFVPQMGHEAADRGEGPRLSRRGEPTCSCY